MEFRKLKGKQEWRNPDGYRITVSTLIGTKYYACVRVAGNWWEFSQHRRPYKTYNAAARACEFNQRIWSAVLKLNEAKGNRTRRVEALRIKGRRGGGNILATVPDWAKKLVSPDLLKLVCKHQNVRTRASKSTAQK